MWKTTVLIAAGAGLLALLATLPAPSAYAAGTTFTGNVTANMTVTLKKALTSTQTLYCDLSISGQDNGTGNFNTKTTVAATSKSSTSYTCSVPAPYVWIDQSTTGATLEIRAEYQAIILDTSVAADLSPTVDESDGSFIVATGLTSGQTATFSQSLELY